jgi:hypothetical protein
LWKGLVLEVFSDCRGFLSQKCDLEIDLEFQAGLISKKHLQLSVNSFKKDSIGLIVLTLGISECFQLKLINF